MNLVSVSAPSLKRSKLAQIALGDMPLEVGAVGYIRLREVDIEAEVKTVTQSSVTLEISLLPGSLTNAGAPPGAGPAIAETGAVGPETSQ